METIIIRGFFGGELMVTVVTFARSIELVKDNWELFIDPKLEFLTVESCSLGRSHNGTFYAMQEEMVVALSYDFITWEEVEDEIDVDIVIN